MQYGDATLQYSVSLQGSNARLNTHTQFGDATTNGNNTNRLLNNFLTESGVSPSSTAQKQFRAADINGKEEPSISSNRLNSHNFKSSELVNSAAMYGNKDFRREAIATYVPEHSRYPTFSPNG